MQDERKLILNMVKDGKISEDEALKLLEALESPKMESDLEESAKTIANRFISGIDSALRKTSDVIQGLDVNDWSLSFGSNKAKTEKFLKKPFDGKKNLKIENFNGNIQIYSWENECIETRASISYDMRKLDPNYDFIIMEEDEESLIIKSNHTKLNNKFECRLSIAIPRTMEKSLSITSVNGSIELNFINASELNLKTTNGNMSLNAVVSPKSIIKTTQGNISLTDFEGDSLNVNSTNGSISITDLSAKTLDAQTINGLVKITAPGPKVENVKLANINGSINFTDLDFNRPIKGWFKSRSYDSYKELSEVFSRIEKNDRIFEVTNLNYDDQAKNPLLIDASTINGRIKIY